MKIKRLLALTLCCVSPLTMANNFVQLDKDNLVLLKETVTTKDVSPAMKYAYDNLLHNADDVLKLKNPTVTEKVLVPPSKDKHDYLSISRYWWPDPAKADGLPWIRKDGITNPSTQNDDVDRNRIGVMTTSVHYLGLAYYLTGNEEYAKKASDMVQAWFLNSETKMNPNLEYAQSVPGNDKGRRSGILDGRLIPLHVLDAITLISKSPNWTDEQDTAMNKWLNEYLAWLTTSDLGIDGSKQTNNHGSWYKFQIAALSWYLEDGKQLDKAIESTKENLNYQFAKDGSQPHELERTRSYFYSTFNLEALTRTAIIADKAGKPIWDVKSPQGNSLKSAIDYLVPAVHGAEWKYPTPGIDTAYLAPLVARISYYTQSHEYDETLQLILKNLGPNDKEAYREEIFDEISLLYPANFK